MRVLIEVEDRIRADSTCVYYRKAFEKVADVVSVYPEELQYIKPGSFDLYVRIDYGVETPFPADLKPSAYYAIDTHIHPDWRLKMTKEADFDYIFCALPQALDLPWHTDKVYWLPHACDPDAHMPQGIRQKKHDICFIGNCQPNWQARRCERLDKLFRAFPNFYIGNKFFKEATEKYAESKLVFNSAQADDINMRVFEALCSGSCLLTDKMEWYGILEPGKHFLQYADEKEMIEKAKYFIEHNEQREEIARQGQKEVLEKHTYLHRVKEMLRIIKEDRE